jgi:hypothetical protein
MGDLAHPTIGDSPDAVGYDAKNKLAFSSNGDGTLTVVDAKGTTILYCRTWPRSTAPAPWPSTPQQTVSISLPLNLDHAPPSPRITRAHVLLSSQAVSPFSL